MTWGAARMSDQQTIGPSQAEVDAIDWWHPFTFPNGVKTRATKGGRGPEFAEGAVRLEAEAAFKYPVEGKSVLDVGAWNGYFSVEAVKRRAARVTALDKTTWEHPQLRGFEGFELARRWLAPGIEAVNRDIWELRTNPVGQFDCVLFLGVLYHLKHPLLALELLYDIAREWLVIETHIDLNDHPRPAMVFYPGAEAGGDCSNWWGPNVACVTAMLATVGFRRIEHAPHPLLVSRAFFYAFK